MIKEFLMLLTVPLELPVLEGQFQVLELPVLERQLQVLELLVSEVQPQLSEGQLWDYLLLDKPQLLVMFQH